MFRRSDRVHLGIFGLNIHVNRAVRCPLGPQEQRAPDGQLLRFDFRRDAIGGARRVRELLLAQHREWYESPGHIHETMRTADKRLTFFRPGDADDRAGRDAGVGMGRGYCDSDRSERFLHSGFIREELRLRARTSGARQSAGTPILNRLAGVSLGAVRPSRLWRGFEISTVSSPSAGSEPPKRTRSD